MGKIRIRYKTLSGDLKKESFDDSHHSIDLAGNAITEIDLTPLKGNEQLRFLDLSWNHLKSLDLTPLSGCRNLENLNIGANRLLELDLNPLENCRNLERFRLIGNSIRELDVNPIIRHRKHKMEYWIGFGVELHIDASFYETDPFAYIDLKDQAVMTPIRRSIEHEGWSSTRARMIRNLSSINSDCSVRTAWFILNQFELGNLIGLDESFLPIVKGTTKKGNYKEVRAEIRSLTIEAIQKQLEQVGPTLLFDIEQMQTTQASVLVKDIIDRRKAEILELTIPVDGNIANLEEFCLTSYGYRIMNSLAIDLRTDVLKLKGVRSELSKIGLDLTTEEVDSSTEVCSTVNITDEMRRYVHAQFSAVIHRMHPIPSISKIIDGFR